MTNYINNIVKYRKNPDSFFFKRSLYEYYIVNGQSDECLERVKKVTNISKKDLKDMIYEYSSRFVSEDESKIILKSDRLDLNVDNPILLNIGVRVKKLWTNEVEKKLVLESIFQYTYKNDFNNESIKDLVDKFDLSRNRILTLIKEAAVTYFGYSKEEFESEFKETRLKEKKVNAKDSVLYKFYKEILDADGNEEVGKIINKEFINMSKLSYKQIELSKLGFNLNEVTIIKCKLDTYKEFLKEEAKKAKEEETKLKKAADEDRRRKLCNDFLEEEVNSIEEFCENKGISYEKFANIRSLLADTDPVLSSKVESKCSVVDAKYKNVLGKKVVLISKSINNPYDGGRVFDILDLLDITKSPSEKLIKIGQRKLSGRDSSNFKNYLRKKYGYEKTNQREIEYIKNEIRIVGVKYDEKGREIVGSGREITMEEKNSLLDYLEKNKYPINNYTYYAALQRYLKGYLVFDKKKLSLIKEN